jgi:hypothetical protein
LQSITIKTMQVHNKAVSSKICMNHVDVEM